MGQKPQAKKVELNKPLKNLYLIFLVGLVLAIGHYFFFGQESFFQGLLVHVFTVFNIGFPLMIIVFNKHIFFGKRSRISEIALLLLSFVVLAMLASELENLFRFLIRNRDSYAPFSNMDLHLANAVITSVLGFAFYYLSDGPLRSGSAGQDPLPSRENAPLERIPVRHQKETLLVELDQVLYIEAYDNYAMVFHTNGEKMLCNYSLGYLEPLLAHSFIRIHRKHMVNRQKIRSLVKHSHKRYLVRLNDDRTELVCSSSYADTIRDLVEI